MAQDIPENCGLTFVDHGGGRSRCLPDSGVGTRAGSDLVGGPGEEGQAPAAHRMLVDPAYDHVARHTMIMSNEFAC